MEATFISKHQENPSITTYFFKPKNNLQYTAGQFIELTLYSTTALNDNRRWFTLSSSPTEELLSITTRHPQNQSEFKKHLQKLKPGDPVSISQSMGDFVLPKDKTIPILFVAAGIGITPVRSMLKYLADSKQNRQITVLYFVRNHPDACFDDILRSQNNPVHVIVLDTTNDNLRDKELLKSVTDYLKGDQQQVYLSGPEKVVELINDELTQLVSPLTRIHTDFFPGYSKV